MQTQSRSFFVFVTAAFILACTACQPEQSVDYGTLSSSCTETLHCQQDADGMVQCESGYEWASDDPKNLRCIARQTDGQGTGGVPNGTPDIPNQPPPSEPSPEPSPGPSEQEPPQEDPPQGPDTGCTTANNCFIDQTNGYAYCDPGFTWVNAQAATTGDDLRCVRDPSQECLPQNNCTLNADNQPACVEGHTPTTPLSTTDHSCRLRTRLENQRFVYTCTGGSVPFVLLANGLLGSWSDDTTREIIDSGYFELTDTNNLRFSYGTGPMAGNVETTTDHTFYPGVTETFTSEHFGTCSLKAGLAANPGVWLCESDFCALGNCLLVDNYLTLSVDGSVLWEADDSGSFPSYSSRQGIGRRDDDGFVSFLMSSDIGNQDRYWGGFLDANGDFYDDTHGLSCIHQ